MLYQLFNCVIPDEPASPLANPRHFVIKLLQMLPARYFRFQYLASMSLKLASLEFPYSVIGCFHRHGLKNFHKENILIYVFQRGSTRKNISYRNTGINSTTIFINTAVIFENDLTHGLKPLLIWHNPSVFREMCRYLHNFERHHQNQMLLGMSEVHLLNKQMFLLRIMYIFFWLYHQKFGFCLA